MEFGRIWLLANSGLMLFEAAVYLFWLKPMFVKSIRAREDAEASERRIQNDAELKANATLLAAQEEAMRIRLQADQEVREKMAVVSKTEDRLCARDEALDQRRSTLEERENILSRDVRGFAERSDGLDRRARSIDEELQRVANLDKAKARELYLKKVEAEFKELGTRRAKEVESQTVADAERRAKKVVLDVIQRNAVDYVTEATLAVV